MDFYDSVRAQALREAAQVAANAILLLSIPAPGVGALTIQQQATDEARQQISAKILALIPKPAPEWMPVEATFLAEHPIGTCNRCGRSTWAELDLESYDDFPQPNGFTCGGRFVRNRS